MWTYIIDNKSQQLTRISQLGREHGPREEDAPRDRGEGGVVGRVQRIVLVIDGSHRGRSEEGQHQQNAGRVPA